MGMFFMFSEIANANAVYYPFSITTINMTTGSTFIFKVSGNGILNVDCGIDGVLSGTGVSGNTITKNTVGDYNYNTYTCTYTSAGIKTIRFGGPGP